MTGARITCTLLNGLARRDKTVGLAAMCVGGGQGMAMILERLSRIAQSGRRPPSCRGVSSRDHRAEHAEGPVSGSVVPNETVGAVEHGGGDPGARWPGERRGQSAS
jgi:hypothetical protein